MSKDSISKEQKVELLANLIGTNFLKLARELRELKEYSPDLFVEVAELAGISSRKAYALAKISRQFDDTGISEGRLYNIGWTKLVLIGRYVGDDNIEQLLELAEKNTVHDLAQILRGETPVSDARVVQLYLNSEDYAKLRKVLLKNGALPAGNGLSNMEAALMAVIEAHQD
ncbi:hypothetical protein L3V16_18915 [Brucella ciceri]|uniref:hypothetical protein n=1 Tax=Brucella ciceri TaxID=391287 RepID=UPI001F134757|nr:hypothetical protein [Brucella ciceri]MCH6205897.1 hypothetical protein [Brucella ciceri]